MRSGVRILAVLTILAGLATFKGGSAVAGVPEAPVPEASESREALPEGGTDLKWCLWGLALYHAGGLLDGDPLEVAGALMVWVNCR